MWGDEGKKAGDETWGRRRPSEQAEQASSGLVFVRACSGSCEINELQRAQYRARIPIKPVVELLDEQQMKILNSKLVASMFNHLVLVA